MEKNKSNTSLILIFVVIIVSAVLTLGVLLYTRGQNVVLNTGIVTSQVTSSNISYSVPAPTGSVLISIVKAGDNKYNLVLDTNGTKVTAIDLRFNISNGLSNVLATKGSITELNDLFSSSDSDGQLVVQAGNLDGYTGSGILATLSETNTREYPTLSLLSTTFINSGVDISLNELSNTLANYSFTLD